MFCQSCGMEVASNYKICPKCGGKIFGHQQVKIPTLPVQNIHSGALPTSPSQNPQSVVSKGHYKVGIISVLLIILVLAGYYGYQTIQIHKQEELARIEYERQRKEMELELERKQREEAAIIERQKQQEEQANREASARQEAYASRQLYAIKNMEFGYRQSFMDNNTKVLQLRNITDTGVSFNLKCCTVDDSCKTIYVSVPAHNSTEVGFMEGWNGNFVSGEYFIAYYEGEEVLRKVMP